MSTEKPVHVARDRYPEAMYPQIINATGGEYPNDEEVHLLDYWRIIVARRWTVAAILSTVVLLTGIYTFRQTPIYRATSSIQIDKENQNILSFQDVYQIETADYDTLQTQFEVLKSRTLARRVIEDLKLDETEEFKRAEPGALSAISNYIQENLLPKPAPKSAPEPDRLRPLIDAYTTKLMVTPVRSARLVNISFDSKDPELAAQVINSHAQLFIDQNIEYKIQATQKASQFLEQNLVTLKGKLEAAEDKLQEYSQQNQILFTDEGKNTATEKLRQLEEAYTKAQEDRINKESYYRPVQTGVTDSLPQLINNTLIADLSAKLVDLRRQDSELEVTFQPEYPARRRLSGQIAQIRNSIDLEKARVVAMIEAEYSASQTREGLLAGELAQQREIVNKINEDIIQYNIYKGEVDSLKQLHDGLQKRLKEASVSAGLTASNIRIVDRAEVPPFPVRPLKMVNGMLGLLAGLVLGVGLAFFLEYLDNTIKEPEDVSRYLNLPTLGMIPKLASLLGGKGYGYGHYGDYKAYGARGAVAKVSGDKSQNVDLIVHEAPSSLMAEAFRSLRTSLLLSSSGHPPRRIVVTSAAPSEGKTTTALNLAISLTQTGSRVVLIDADMRKPRIQVALSLSNAVGLSAFLAGASTLKDIIHKTPVPGLMAIPCGVTPPNPSELILSDGFRKMLEALAEYFDYIVLDSPPVGNVSDARILAAEADATILVIKAFSTSRHQAREAVAHLTNAQARVRGVVLNDVDVRRRSHYSGHSYYRTYYSDYRSSSEKTSAAS
jgi:polysaccharide biosynthesis transport protein